MTDFKIIKKHFSKNDPIIFKLFNNLSSENQQKIAKQKLATDLFRDLVESIISQQLSIKAADTIYGRLEALFANKKITPQKLLNIDDQALRSVGLSFGKIGYLKDLSLKIVSGELKLDQLHLLTDQQVILELTKVKGIGQWTAEMFLMSALGRENIFSHGDLGLRNAIIKNYHLVEYKTDEVEEIIIKWSPYKTIASRILWRSLK